MLPSQAAENEVRSLLGGVLPMDTEEVQVPKLVSRSPTVQTSEMTAAAPDPASSDESSDTKALAADDQTLKDTLPALSLQSGSACGSACSLGTTHARGCETLGDSARERKSFQEQDAHNKTEMEMRGIAFRDLIKRSDIRHVHTNTLMHYFPCFFSHARTHPF